MPAKSFLPCSSILSGRGDRAKRTWFAGYKRKQMRTLRRMRQFLPDGGDRGLDHEIDQLISSNEIEIFSAQAHNRDRIRRDRGGSLLLFRRLRNRHLPHHFKSIRQYSVWINHGGACIKNVGPGAWLQAPRRLNCLFYMITRLPDIPRPE
jgi:hypothetical protein